MIAHVDDVERIRRGVLNALPTDLSQLLPPPELMPASAAVRAELERFLGLLTDYPSRAGKGIRGRLLLLSAEAHGAQAGSSGAEAALTLAEALELFQNWVLVHDDIEDGSEERRGSPALHRLVGMPVALNVGDAMHVHMWRLLHGLLAGPPTAETAQVAARAALATRVLEEFGGMVTRTAEGQHLDLAWVEDGRFDELRDQIASVKAACGDKILKVIIETCLLTEEEKIQMCHVVSVSGADYIKTSTGFSTGGATFDDVALMAKYVAPHVKIKAAGGISSIEDAEKFIALGADRLGTSRIVKIAKGLENDGSY